MTFDRWFKVLLLALVAIAVVLYATDARRQPETWKPEYWFTSRSTSRPPGQIYYAFDRTTGVGYRLANITDNMAVNCERSFRGREWLRYYPAVPSATE